MVLNWRSRGALSRGAWWVGLLLGSVFAGPGRGAEFIIVPPTVGKSSASSQAASSAREKASSQRSDADPAPPLSTLIKDKDQDEEEGLFGVRPGAGAAIDHQRRARAYRRADGNDETEGLDRLLTDPESSRGKLRANMDRARANQRSGSADSGDEVEIDLDQLLIDPESSRGKVRINVDRARNYQKGRSPGFISPNLNDSTHLPVVDCNAIGNVAGRIGDDYAPGSVIIIMRDGKGIKVRCK